MELRDIQKILSDNLDNAILKTSPLGNGTTKISARCNTIKSLENISEIESFSDLIDHLKEISEIYNNDANDITIDSNIVIKFEQILNRIQNRGIEFLII